jgi:Holliday junction resolvase
MIQPTIWTVDGLRADVDQARAIFRRERTDEPLERYSSFFEKFSGIFADLVDELNSFAAADNPELLSQIMRDASRKTALRYLAAPPISEDDLKVLADTKLSATALRSDPAGAKQVREILLHIIDQHRFPWVKENRAPSDQEREIAIVSSAALVAAKKVETERRGNATKFQEQSVKSLLKEMGFVEVQKKTVRLIGDAPTPGHFCGECVLGDTRADLIIGLHDRRVLAIECKASNSEVNSFKRVNHEAAGKATKWLTKFGTEQIVPCSVLSGVFGVTNLASAQRTGLYMFWSHRLSDLAEFIEGTK